MQTPKPRSGSSEAPQKASPVTPRTNRQLKISAPDTDSISSHTASRTPKDRSPKVTERRSPRSPVTEKKRPSKLSELEAQVAQLHGDLKATKEQLGNSEASRNSAQQEAEEVKNQLTALNAKLEESQRQLAELSASEETRLQVLQNVSHDKDPVLQSEQSVDTTPLDSAVDEIQRLKSQLEKVAESELAHAKHAEAAYTEIQSLKSDLGETIAHVENLNAQLKDSKDSEAQAEARLNETLLLFETVKTNGERLRLDGMKAMEAYSSMREEFEKSKRQVISLEELVSKLQSDLLNERHSNSGHPLAADEYSREVGEDGQLGETHKLRTELDLVKLEVEKLQSALEDAEGRLEAEQIKSSLEKNTSYELVEQIKSEASSREALLVAELNKANDCVEELKATLMDKETELQSVSEENEVLNVKIMSNESIERLSELECELKKSKEDVGNLKASLMEKQAELQIISEENEMFNSEAKKRELEMLKPVDAQIAEVESARAAEQEALMKLAHMKDQVDESSRRAARMTEQLEAAQASNSEMEAELRRLKVQADQWRKAAEAAAAVLSTGNNGKYMERTGSLDSNFHPITGKLSSPFSEDLEEDSPKKKNNMLKKFGVLWKKGSK